jgi:hypothetical protein
LSARSATALLKAAELGWTVILSTARPVRAIKWAVPKSFGRFYWAACNGAWLIKDGEILQRREIVPEDVRHLTDLFTRQSWSFQVEAEDRMFTDCGVPDGFAGQYYPLSQLGCHGACKLIVNVSCAEEAAKVMTMLPESCIGVVTDKCTLVQISHARCHKLAAVTAGLEREGIALEETIAFGDDNNDLLLVQAVGCGVAMANATPELKRAARRLTASNDEDGVAQFLEKAV